MMNAEIVELIYEHYQTMEEKKFHEKPLDLIQAINLISSEIGEAVEADRMGKWCKKWKCDIFYEDIMSCIHITPEGPQVFETLIKDHVEDEFADIMLRVWDLIGRYNIQADLIKEIVYGHRQKAIFRREDFQGIIYEINREILDLARVEKLSLTMKVEALSRLWIHIEDGADLLGIDLEYHIRAKMAYNRTRERKHGKKY